MYHNLQFKQIDQQFLVFIISVIVCIIVRCLYGNLKNCIIVIVPKLHKIAA